MIIIKKKQTKIIGGILYILCLRLSIGLLNLHFQSMQIILFNIIHQFDENAITMLMCDLLSMRNYQFICMHQNMNDLFVCLLFSSLNKTIFGFYIYGLDTFSIFFAIWFYQSKKNFVYKNSLFCSSTICSNQTLSDSLLFLFHSFKPPH